jgi:hypothetical protein
MNDDEEIKLLRVRLCYCESALIAMVKDYCKGEKPDKYDNVLTADEIAFDYLVDNGYAKWAGSKNKDIVFI